MCSYVYRAGHELTSPRSEINIYEYKNINACTKHPCTFEEKTPVGKALQLNSAFQKQYV